MKSENKPKKQKSLFRRIVITALITLIVGVFLFVPYNHDIYKDGPPGTEEWRAVSYLVVKWSPSNAHKYPNQTKIYFFPFSLLSLSQLDEIF